MKTKSYFRSWKFGVFLGLLEKLGLTTAITQSLLLGASLFLGKYPSYNTFCIVLSVLGYVAIALTLNIGIYLGGVVEATKDYALWTTGKVRDTNGEDITSRVDDELSISLFKTVPDCVDFVLLLNSWFFFCAQPKGWQFFAVLFGLSAFSFSIVFRLTLGRLGL